jgi:formylmethanofuran dehydrogenase subunit E
MTNIDTYLERLNAFHSHLCPKQVLGVRTGIYAGELLALALPQSDKRLFTFVETDGCFADGVVVATGCAAGHRTLRHMDYGKVAATFVDRETGRAVRIWPTAQSRARARELAPDAPDTWHAQLAAYQHMPVTELLNARAVSLAVSLEALISEPGLRVVCQQCGEDIINGREADFGGRILCRTCAGDGYYVDSPTLPSGNIAPS